ncbi:UNKNOWN [Stylonychia lemnae]|uniref:Uncharacterized protein n=1 Tax=Stylonychia lemnae TaxID=5949 RepID=A0A078B5Y9_STYLE|nr:UNKNOWN [Stylonychia lemnae]|eukprot:CDW89834.1 UNKNOWN [Stylonychia lemnae]
MAPYTPSKILQRPDDRLFKLTVNFNVKRTVGTLTRNASENKLIQQQTNQNRKISDRSSSALMILDNQNSYQDYGLLNIPSYNSIMKYPKQLLRKDELIKEIENDEGAKILSPQTLNHLIKEKQMGVSQIESTLRKSRSTLFPDISHSKVPDIITNVSLLNQNGQSILMSNSVKGGGKQGQKLEKILHQTSRNGYIMGHPHTHTFKVQQASFLGRVQTTNHIQTVNISKNDQSKHTLREPLCKQNSLIRSQLKVNKEQSLQTSFASPSSQQSFISPFKFNRDLENSVSYGPACNSIICLPQEKIDKAISLWDQEKKFRRNYEIQMKFSNTLKNIAIHQELKKKHSRISSLGLLPKISIEDQEEYDEGEDYFHMQKGLNKRSTVQL